MEFLTGEQAKTYGAFTVAPTRSELERFFHPLAFEPIRLLTGPASHCLRHPHHPARAAALVHLVQDMPRPFSPRCSAST
ncbi:hypothetical protein AB0C52_24520 [Streptomyces sp. NPDC048717]|uniref:hypothetical protein n=1 Tax=Streptomyces sp. NPDC048717 TaxID=3154928 RepID=UPI0034260421